jgi:RecA-family ATPase
MLEIDYEDLDEAERRSRAGAAANEPLRPPLSIEEWLSRDLPAPDFLMGRWFSTTSRFLLNAPTGIGKTNFMLALFAHIAAGRDFLHWKSGGPRRVLFVDGEMSRRLLKRRAEDVVRRLGIKPHGLHLLSREDFEDFGPLNTESGHEFINAIIRQIGGVDAACFDNVMSLISGDMKDEEAW